LPRATLKFSTLIHRYLFYCECLFLIFLTFFFFIIIFRFGICFILICLSWWSFSRKWKKSKRSLSTKFDRR
jgi:hypothetical protein